MQASNHRGAGAAFTQDELHLLRIIATQAAPVIENVSLVQQSRQRAQRAEALRRIASLASSAATLDEILLYSLQELAHLLRAGTAAIFLLDEGRGELHAHRPSLFGVPAEVRAGLERIPIEDPQFHFTAAGGLHAFITGNALEDQTLLPVYRPAFEALGIGSAVVVPLVVRDHGIGELWLGSHAPDFFDRSDLQVVTTAAGQLAGVIERSSLAEQTDAGLRRRVGQLEALTRISRELSTTLDLKYLLQMVYDEALRTTHADCGTILLFDLEAKSPPGASVMFFVGDEPASRLSNLQRLAAAGAEPLRVADFSQSEYAPAHSGIQSALTVPILYRERVAGLIDLHAWEPGCFDDTAEEITQTLAVQASIVLGNALQYQEQVRRGELLDRRVTTLAKLQETSRDLQSGQSMQQALSAIASGIREVTPFDVVLISVYHPESDALERVCGLGLKDSHWEELRAHSQPWGSLQSILRPEFRVSASYFIPCDKQPAVPEDVHALVVLPHAERQATDAWDPEDALLLPLEDVQGRPVGLISLDAPRDGRRPDRPTIETLEVFATFATLLIQNDLRIAAIRGEADELRAEGQRLAGAAQAGQARLPEMLHKDLSQALSIHQLKRQTQRIRDGLEIAEAANRQTDGPSVLRTLAREVLVRAGLELALVAESAPSGPKLVEVIGEAPEGASPEALFGQPNPLRHSFQDGQIRLVAALEGEAESRPAPLLKALQARSLICLPISVEGKVAASILLVGRNSLPAFDEDDRQVYALLARQVAISLQNLSLLGETQRRLQEVDLLLEFSRQLGSLDPTNILSVLVNSALRAIPAAHTGMAALWDAKAACLSPQAAAGYADVDSLLQIGHPLDGGLPGEVFASGQARRVGEVEFARDYRLPAEDLLRYRRATAGRLPVSSLLVPIRVGEARLGLLVLDSFTTPEAFTGEDEAMLVSLAGQAALALENARLFQASEERAGQLLALNNVAATITSSLQSDELIASLLEELDAVLPYETGALWLRRGEILTVAAARGFPDNEDRVGLSVAVEDSALFREMIQTGQALLVSDTQADPRFPALAPQERRSWLGIPLVAKGEVIGAFALEKQQADFYTPGHVQAAATFAGQAAVALENARLYEESLHKAADLNERSQRLALLNRLSSLLSASLDLSQILQVTARELLRALNASVVSALLFDEQGQAQLYCEAPGGESQPPLALPDAPLFARLRESMGIFSAGDVLAEAELEPLSAFLAERDTHSLLALPLPAGPALQGVFLVQTSFLYRFSSSEIELARTISNQAAIAVQNARLFAETRLLTEDLEHRVRERTAELTHEHHNTETLLRIITELSASLDMEQVLNRTLLVLNEAVGSEQSAILLSRAGGLQVYFRVGQDVELAETGLDQIEQNIAGWAVEQRKPAFLDDLFKEGRWLGQARPEIPYHTVLAVPLILGEELLGALVLYRRQAAGFASTQLGLIEAAARQISITLNNSELFTLIRDQAERLGTMLRDQQIEASRSRAILEAVADGVLVTDANNRITLFNASAERILGLHSEQVVGRSLENFVGLFGKAGRAWMGTIHDWSQSPEGDDYDGAYSEQITLETGQVVAVNLAPAIWRAEFLGTVSIFRDITHEVMVDRLKTEFVANVSHELRTPMTSIKGYVELLLMGAAGMLSEQQTHFLQIVKSNTDRLSVLVNDLLDVSRIEAGRVTLSQQPLDLRVIAEDVAADLRRRSQEENKPITITLELPAELPQVSGDPERVRQVLANLVSNAYCYTPPGGRVQVRLCRAAEEVQVDVRDNGIGISPEDQPRIFERFYRGEDPLVLATPGTGLGLSIVRNLVDMHHGRIWFESKGVPGDGSTFSFTLPVAAAEE